MQDAPRLIRDEEVVSLMHTLQLEHPSHVQQDTPSSTSCTNGSGSKRKPPGHNTARGGLFLQQLQQLLPQRMKQRLAGFSPELLAITLVYFVQGILKLSSLAVTFFFKDQLKLEPTQMALADTITAVPWTIKPLYGFLSDSVPIWGMRRRPYLILSGLLGCAAWLCMAGLANSVATAIACITVAAAATAFSDVVADSIVVQLARESPGATEGALQSMCWSAHAFGRLLTAYLSGWLLGKLGPRPVFAATATFPLIVCASSCLIKESPASTTDGSNKDLGVGKPHHSTAQHGGGDGGDGGVVGRSGGSTVANPFSQPQQQQLPFDSQATAGAAGAGGVCEEGAAGVSANGGRGFGGALASHGSTEVLLSQLQLTQGQLHHKHRQQQQGRDGDSSQQQQTWSHAAAAGGLIGGEVLAGKAAAGGGSLLREVAVNMTQSVRLFWNAIKQPHMLRPVLFIFLFQAMPQPDSAMFYFKTNKLGFDAEFFGRVKLVAALADLAGLAVYNAWLKSARLRPMLFWGALLGCAVGLTPLLLVEGVNRKLGVSDRLFAMVDSALLASIGQVLMMPTLVLCARLCPEGVEATLYASLMSLNNAAVGVGSLFGAAMMKLFGITSTDFSHLTALLLTCNMMSLLPLPLVRWVPDSNTQGVLGTTTAGSAMAGGGVDGTCGSVSEEGAALLEAAERSGQQPRGPAAV